MSKSASIEDGRFIFDWEKEDIDPNDIDLNNYELPYMPKKNISKLDDRCKICIYKQVEKYKGHLDEVSKEQIGDKGNIDYDDIPF